MRAVTRDVFWLALRAWLRSFSPDRLAAAFFAAFFSAAFWPTAIFSRRRPPDLGVVPSAQDLVDEGLIAFALGAEVVEQVAVEPQRDDVLAGRNDDVGLVPVDVEGRGVRVVGHGAAISSSVIAVEAGVVGFAFKRRASSRVTRVILSLVRAIGFPRADDAAVCAAPSVGDDVDSALDFAERVDAGFAIIGAVVDGFVRWTVEQRGHAAEVDTVLDEVASRLSSSHSKAIADQCGWTTQPCQYNCNCGGVGSG